MQHFDITDADRIGPRSFRLKTRQGDWAFFDGYLPENDINPDILVGKTVVAEPVYEGEPEPVTSWRIVGVSQTVFRRTTFVIALLVWLPILVALWFIIN